MTTRLVVVIFAVIATFSIACTSDEALEIVVPVSPTTTPIPLPGSLARDQPRNKIVNEAIRFATAGCPGIDEKLSGPPTRILAALTNVMATGNLTNPETVLEQEVSGPGGSGTTVWVVAIEGSSIPVFGDDPWGGTNIRSFVFVTRTTAREVTGCVVRDAPMPTKYKYSLFTSSFKFEVLFDK